MRKTIISIIFAAACLCACMPRAQFNSPSAKLRMAEAAITNFYVDSVNENTLVEDAIRGMLEKLDPHSAYTNAEETRELNEPLQGNFSGVGITFNMASDTLYVIQTVSGGPAERVGLLAGDRIIAVNDTAIAGVKMKNSDVMKRLRGPKGTIVDVTVLRGHGAKRDTVPFRITRDDIPIHSVEAAYMADPITGYIRLSRFAADTPAEMAEAIAKLKKEGMTGLILDLTDNGGGYLNAATDLLGEFLEPGSLAVFTEGLNSPRQNLMALPSGRNPLFPDGRLVVMVNQYSASAAEITSGAVQDHDRGVVVGRRTFGKGLVQRPFPFPDGSMMRLTVAHYFTPTGRDIQKPYTKGDRRAYAEDMNDRFKSGELMHEDSIKYVDSLRVNTLRLNRPIYGGGGISPDRFVPLDTTAFTKYYRSVLAKGIINRYVVDYVDNNRSRLLANYADDNEFAARFEVTPQMLQALYDLASADEIEFDPEQAALSTPLFQSVVKALIGRDIFNSATYWKVINASDPIFREAYSIITGAGYDNILQPTQQ